LAPELGRYCTQAPSTIATSDNMLYVKYFTNITDPNNGFRAVVSLGKQFWMLNEIGQNHKKSCAFLGLFERGDDKNNITAENALKMNSPYRKFIIVCGMQNQTSFGSHIIGLVVSIMLAVGWFASKIKSNAHTI